MQIEPLQIAAGLALGAAGYGCVSFFIFRLRERALRAELAASEHQMQVRLRQASETELAQARLALKEQLALERTELERAMASRREIIESDERRLVEREQSMMRQMDRLGSQELELRVKGEALEGMRIATESERSEVRRQAGEAVARLERIAQLDGASARTVLLREVERESARDAADLSRHIIENARTQAEAEARRIVGIALQRYAATHTFETTTATVALTTEDMKGRIIGRDGRNIRAFEAVTGVTVLVDDTPNAVVLSGFDPVRREVARLAMERLILDGRIHPVRIEEVVAAVNSEMDDFILRAGTEAIYRAGLSPLSNEISRTLGKLRFRNSYSQNVLEHSVEVAHLCGLMAAELGEDIQSAKRSGLLHDIGKAMGQEFEGPHALVGADFLKREGETADIVNAVASHHDEVPHENLLGVLVAAADAISASRPGARSESMTTYIKRLQNLEEIAVSFPGVEKAFAVQAGRELRVVVRPEAIDDAAAHQMARQMARKIEEVLLYPGQIRITVVREMRCVEYAK
jgi:ribonuclease Y